MDFTHSFALAQAGLDEVQVAPAYRGNLDGAMGNHPDRTAGALSGRSLDWAAPGMFIMTALIRLQGRSFGRGVFKTLRGWPSMGLAYHFRLHGESG